MNNPRGGQTAPCRLAIIGAVMEAPPVAARILIIEDDPNVAEVVGRYLTREGYDVEIATDGVSGLDRALSDPPELVALTAKEFDLLAHLMEHPRRAFRREELLERVWGFSYGDTSTVTVHIRRLREKIEADPSAPRYVTTVWGVGYRFEP